MTGTRFAPDPSPPRLLRRIVQFPLVRIVIGLLMVVGALNLAQYGLKRIDPSVISRPLWPPFILIPVLVASYVLFVKLIEHRSVHEFSVSGVAREFGLGYAAGASIFCAVVASLSAVGSYAVTGYNGWGVLAGPFVWMLFAAFLEEILFRGIIFRIIEESLGTGIALLISAGLFGAAHLINPHATIASALAIAIEAGLLLGAVYVYTRRLWMCIGLHAAWNFTQGAVFSIPVSGTSAKGLIDGKLLGPDWLTGGDFGAEASVIAVLLCALVMAGILRAAYLRERFIAPFWSRRIAQAGLARHGAVPDQ